MTDDRRKQFHAKMFQLLAQILSPDTNFFKISTGDLGLKEVWIIRYLGNNTRATMSELANRVNIPLSTMTGIADKMAERDLVVRHRSETDRRVVELELASGGKKVFEEESNAFKGWFNQMFEPLTDEEKNQALVILGKMTTPKIP